MEWGQILEPRGLHEGSGGSPAYFTKLTLDVFHRYLERFGVPADAIALLLPDHNLPEKKTAAHYWSVAQILPSLVLCPGFTGCLCPGADKPILQFLPVC